MPRKQKKYHYIYKTTNILNNKFYIGMHSTDNLDDGYVGSGKRLWYSINKHGKENHVCKILKFLSDRNILREEEARLVNEEMLQDPLCMNLTLGGSGGWDAANRSYTPEKRKALGEYGRKYFLHGAEMKKRLIEKGDWEKYLINISLSKLAYFAKGNPGHFSGKKHTVETKQKMAESHKRNNHQKGAKNSQYGTCYVSHLFNRESKRIKKDKLDEYLKDGWIKKRIINFDAFFKRNDAVIIKKEEGVKVSRGEDSNMRKGYWITPAGKFETCLLASKENNCSPKTIERRAKNKKFIYYWFEAMVED